MPYSSLSRLQGRFRRRRYRALGAALRYHYRRTPMRYRWTPYRTRMMYNRGWRARGSTVYISN